MSWRSDVVPVQRTRTAASKTPTSTTRKVQSVLVQSSPPVSDASSKRRLRSTRSLVARFGSYFATFIGVRNRQMSLWQFYRDRKSRFAVRTVVYMQQLSVTRFDWNLWLLVQIYTWNAPKNRSGERRSGGGDAKWGRKGRSGNWEKVCVVVFGDMDAADITFQNKKLSCHRKAARCFVHFAESLKVIRRDTL